MTITKGVISEMFEEGVGNKPQLVRMDQHFVGSNKVGTRRTSTIGWWTTDEHEKFLEAVELYPSGPWKKIARHIGSRTPRQVMTHAQKYRQRIKRRGNRKSRRKTKKKSTESVVTEVEGTTKIAEEEQTLCGPFWQEEVRLLEPLCLYPDNDNEMFGQPPEEISALDILLLQQLIVPAEDSVPELVSLDGDELIELLVDSSNDWTAVNSSSDTCMLLS
ncbi:hypothetical protein V7S43_002856 [Phytophthora oleae]|uniref:Myb-like DNA-binding protein n=1 Tax=Phytophthora oleae TaxID=2107226 RepID=A0ABD3G160_9STRA